MSQNSTQILNPYVRRNREHVQTISSFTALQRNYLLLVVVSGGLVFYFGYTSSFFSVSFQYQLLTGNYKSIMHRFGNTGSSSNSSSSNVSMLSNMNSIGKSPLVAKKSIREGKIFKNEMACNIPVLNPFDKSILRYNVNPKPANCTAGHPLIFKTDLQSNLIQVQDPSLYGYFNCCYQSFIRGKGDKKIELDVKCIPIKQPKISIPDKMVYISVGCSKIVNGSSKFITVDFFGIIHLKKSVEKRIEKLNAKRRSKENSLSGTSEPPIDDTGTGKNDASPKRMLNVVILGLDAMSHMNFIRTMPLTYKYLTNNLSAIGFDGYVKIADNTFPNMVPALTGQSVKEPENACWKGKPFDKCPFIWKEFAEKGYRTAYGEDAVWMGIFNFNKKGFKEIPTDYYYPPLEYQLEKRLGHRRLMLTDLCYGSVMCFEVSLDFLQKMAFTMNKTRRYFQFIWATGMTHDYLNAPKHGDKPLLETLRWFKNEGYLEDTAFILMSDHGLRWGSQRSTLQGRLEERMPFLYFVFPEWFKEKYRPAVSNMIRNRNRLTTPFDFHETLRDLSELANISGSSIRNRYEELSKLDKMPRGISLFLPIPLERTCFDAGIADHFCVCRAMKSVNIENNTLIDEAARSVVHHINGMFIRFPQCMMLTLNKIFNAQVFQSSSSKVKDAAENITSSDDPMLKSQQVTYSLSLSVLPSHATFEATITRHTDGTWKVSGEISRTNVYGDQSICVTDYDLKKFCYCF